MAESQLGGTADRQRLPPPRVLVVDDEVDMLELVQQVLELARCQVTVARSGEEALQTLQQAAEDGREFDLVLLDILMPGIDGYQVIARAKADPQLSHTPIIMMTALDSVTNKTQGLGMGADDYITKPFDPQELLARVDVALRIRRTERTLRRRNEQLAILNEIGRMVTSSLELDVVLAATMRGIREILQVEAGSVCLVDEETGELVFRRTLSPQHGWITGQTLAPGEGIVGHVVQTGQPRLVNDVGHDPHFLAHIDEATGLTARAILCVPLVFRERVIGAIEVINKLDGEFTADDLDLLQTMAASVAVAVENANLYSELADFTEELEHSQAQLVQAAKMAAIGRLAASIAHEINNPLQAIHNSLHLTIHQQLDEEKRARYLQLAQEEVERLIQIVQRMLDFYRPSCGRILPTDTNEVIHNVLAIASKQLQHSKVHVHTRLSPHLPLVPTVPDQLTQVFLNIVINAIEAMPEGGDLRLGTTCSEDGEWVVAAFRDSGPGLSTEEQANIFEPFYTTKPSGTGLGLAVSYGIIERHGGTIEVHSRPGQGATFIIRLPVHPAKA